MRMVWGLAIFHLAIGCASSEHAVGDLDDSLEVKGHIDGSEIGLNDDGEAVIQQQSAADDELRQQMWVNSRLEDRLDSEHHALMRCRTDLADPRLGGNGTLTDIPAIDQMQRHTEVKEQFGLTEAGDLRVIKRQKYLDKLQQSRRYETSLKSMQRLISQHRRECERHLGYARVRHGLPAERYRAKGYFTASGRWIQERQGELTLDDAFKIRSQEQRDDSLL